MGRLNPILNHLQRTYVWGDNLNLSDQPYQLHPMTVEAPFTAEDARRQRFLHRIKLISTYAALHRGSNPHNPDVQVTRVRCLGKIGTYQASPLANDSPNVRKLANLSTCARG